MPEPISSAAILGLFGGAIGFTTNFVLTSALGKGGRLEVYTNTASTLDLTTFNKELSLLRKNTQQERERRLSGLLSRVPGGTVRDLGRPQNRAVVIQALADLGMTAEDLRAALRQEPFEQGGYLEEEDSHEVWIPFWVIRHINIASSFFKAGSRTKFQIPLWLTFKAVTLGPQNHPVFHGNLAEYRQQIKDCKIIGREGRVINAFGEAAKLTFEHSVADVGWYEAPYIRVNWYFHTDGRGAVSDSTDTQGTFEVKADGSISGGGEFTDKYFRFQPAEVY